MSIIRERRGGTRLSDPMVGSRDAGPYHDHPMIGMLHMAGRYLEFRFLRHGDFDRTSDWTTFVGIGGGTDGAVLSTAGGGLQLSAAVPATGVGGQWAFLGDGRVRPIALRNASSWGFGAFFGEGNYVTPQVAPVHYFIGFSNSPGLATLLADGSLNSGAIANFIGFHYQSGVQAIGRPRFVAKGSAGSVQEFPFTISSSANNTEVISGWWGFRLDTHDTVSAYRVENPADMVDEIKPIRTIVSPTRMTTSFTNSIDMTLVFTMVHASNTAYLVNNNYFGVWDGCITRGTFIRSTE